MRFLVVLSFACAASLAQATCHDLLITPDVVAIARDPHGRLTPVRKSPDEAVESHILGQTTNWDYRREGVVVPLRLYDDAYGIRLGPEAAWLPRDLHRLLARGGRFETTTDPARASAYSLWMMAPPEGSLRRGRTGILLRNERPIVVTNPRSGAQYLVEVKGAGLPTGGYVKSEHYRALQGGLWERHAETEFNRLRGLFGADTESVKGLAYHRFRGAFGGQDVLFRLTPGSLRASLRGPSSLKRTPAQVDTLVERVGVRLAEVLAQGHFAYSHPENFVVDLAADDVWLTDLLDVLPLRQLPRRVEREVMDEPRALVGTLAISKLFSEYEAGRHWPIFWSAVVRTLVGRGVISPAASTSLHAAGDSVQAALELLGAGLAERIVRDRQRHGYDPLDDEDLARAVNATCAPPEPLAHGRHVAEFLGSLPTDSIDPDVVEMANKIRGEAERLAAGEVSFKEWLNLPQTKLQIRLNSLLNLNGVYVSPAEDELFFLIHLMTADAFPGWFELKRHIEREHLLLGLALRSHPDDLDLRRNFNAIADVARWYNEVPLGAFIEMMCTNRAAFREKFRLPYHR